MNLIELTDIIPTEFDAVEYLEFSRWNDIIQCPYCNSKNIGNRQQDWRWYCRDCKKPFSVTTETMLHNTRLPLRKWLMAFCVISNAKKGVSAKQLSRDIGVHYESAWTMYHKIRDMMTFENDAKYLKDIVELDTKQIDLDNRKSQREKKKQGKGTYRVPELDKEIEQYEAEGFEFKEGKYKKPFKVGKQPTGEGATYKKIGGAVQRNGDVIAHVIANTKFSELSKLIKKHVNLHRDKTVLITDTATGSQKMHEIINHIAINHFKMYSYKGLNTNTIESFWAIVERQIIGSHHHVEIEYLEKYVAEAVFKWSNRNEDDMFETLVDICVCPFLKEKIYPEQRVIALRNKKLKEEWQKKQHVRYAKK